MYLDYSKLSFDADGNPEMPVLLLQTMSEDTIGVIPGVFNLQLRIKFSEPSEISFDVPAVIDGKPNWIYDRLTGHKIIYTKDYGIYVSMNPSVSSDGMEDVKHITGYSIESALEMKRFFLEEGTFKFYDQTNQKNPDTIMGRILEIAPGWSAGEVSPSVAQRYRTFDQYDDYLLSFIYETAPEKFRCVFVFDPYTRRINVYDADEQLDTLPIYLDFDNLLESIDIEEISDELVTAMRPYGADELDIRDVNPIGTNWIYDLRYFIENGDIPENLAEKWDVWQASIVEYREHYRALVALRASTTAQLLAEQAALADLNGELETLTAQQSVTIQALAMEFTSAGIASQQALLDEINASIAAKKQEIAEKESVISSLEDELNPEKDGSYAQQIQDIVDELAVGNYFTAEEYQALQSYFIEQDLTEESFVASTVDTEISGQSYTLSGEQVSITGSAIVKVDLTAQFGKRMYTLAGGTFSFSGDLSVSGDVIRGTLEEQDDGDYVLSIYGGTISTGEASAPSAMITVSGVLTGLVTDIHPVTVDEVTTQEGTSIQFTSTSGNLYLTANVSEYQKYSVKMELYEFAVATLRDAATPTYEFSVDSGNFIFSSEFVPFRDRLELGKGVYLKIRDKEMITPYIIEFELNFEERQDFAIIFSNRFKRHDNCNTLKDMIEQGYSSGRSFDASKYIYNQTVNQASAVSEFMNSSLDAAKNSIIAAANQSVVINGAGIHIGGDSNYQLRIVDHMIAMTDDNWAHAKLAIGLFASEDVGSYFGVNAEVIGGKLLVGNNLVIENETDDGVMQFKVDASGAWLNNATMIFQKDNGGKMIIDPKYGLAAGTSSLFTTDGTTVTPSFVDEDGTLILDEDGMPEDANFFLDLRDGSAYFRGTVYATDGRFSGTVYATDGEFTGTVNATDGVFNGTVYATDGEFKGTVNATDLQLGGISISEVFQAIGDTELDYLKIGVIEIDGATGEIRWNTASGAPVMYQYSENGYNWHDTMYSTDYWRRESWDGGRTWGQGYQFRGKDGEIVDFDFDTVNAMLGYMFEEGTTNISGSHLYSPEIYGATIYAGTGGSTLARMDGNGFAVYHEDNNQPKVYMGATSSGNACEIRIGAGAAAYMTDIMHLVKYAGTGGIYYYTESGEQIGFTFNSDGTIDVLGVMEGYGGGGTVTAVWA